jgi:hypothetical protein
MYNFNTVCADSGWNQIGSLGETASQRRRSKAASPATQMCFLSCFREGLNWDGGIVQGDISGRGKDRESSIGSTSGYEVVSSSELRHPIMRFAFKCRYYAGEYLYLQRPRPDPGSA